MRTTRILGEQVYISLYRDVTNASDLRKSLVAAAIAIGDEGNAARERVNFAFINASMICSSLHLDTAIQQALLARTNDSLRSKTVHSEILYALHPTPNIGDAIRRFGIGESSKDVLVVRVEDHDGSSSETELSRIMDSLVHGVYSDPSEGIPLIADWDAICKIYKIPSPSSKLAQSDATEVTIHERKHQAVNLIVSVVSAKPVA